MHKSWSDVHAYLTRVPAYHGTVAPREVILGLMTVLDGKHPGLIAVHLDSVENPEQTTWRIAAVAEGKIVSIVATADAGFWSWSDHRREHTLEITSRPLSEVVSVTLAKIELHSVQSESDVAWSGVWTITFRDGSTVAIPGASRDDYLAPHNARPDDLLAQAILGGIG